MTQQQSTAFDSHVSGIVRSVNDKGLKLEGQESWLNFSKFAVGIVAPERGQLVTCTLDKAGFLRAVVAAESSAPRIAGGSDARPAVPTARERTITRLAVLKAAAEFAGFRGDLKSGDVLKIAASWERWVNREDAEPSFALPADAGFDDDGLDAAF